jgi:hypothetical protein
MLLYSYRQRRAALRAAIMLSALATLVVLLGLPAQF